VSRTYDYPMIIRDSFPLQCSGRGNFVSSFIKLYSLAFLQVAEAAALDSREVYENIFTHFFSTSLAELICGVRGVSRKFPLPLLSESPLFE